MAEAFNSLFKAECVRNLLMKKSGWHGINDVEIAVAEYIDWYNHRRLHGEIGHIPPAEAEAAYWSKHQVDQYPQEHPAPLESSNHGL